MLSERIQTLYALLQCNNTDIARFAGCSSGNISKLKTGSRVPAPGSRAMLTFVQGVYGYADDENLLGVLSELCGVSGTDRATLLPALTAWLYDTRPVSLPARPAAPRSRETRARRRQSFGERLGRAMTLLELSNGRLASLLSIDGSLVSRYRAGLYSPHENEDLAEKLAAVLLTWAERRGARDTLAGLCGVSEEELSREAVSRWLYGEAEGESTALARRLLRTLDEAVPDVRLPPVPAQLPSVEIAPRYWGTEGLRSAVVRFLSDAAREGGELLLYSDEPMEWMSGDPGFFALWAALMAQCVRAGVSIRIIHNVDREGPEMIDAIRGWFPLYISGRIEPYVFTRAWNPRFCHTMFLHAGHACIRSFFPAGGKERWYDYVTDGSCLGALEREYKLMLDSASPFLSVYTSSMGEEFRAFRMREPGKKMFLVSGLPPVTMPEELLEGMLSRAEIEEEQRRRALTLYRGMRERFLGTLARDSVHILLCPSHEEERRVNFSLDLAELSLSYTPEEYRAHLSAAAELVRRERRFHLTLLPEAPFRDIQITILRGAVAVLRNREPHAAFVFRNLTLTESVTAYISMLSLEYARDRHAVIAALLRSAEESR